MDVGGLMKKREQGAGWEGGGRDGEGDGRAQISDLEPRLYKIYEKKTREGKLEVDNPKK